MNAMDSEPSADDRFLEFGRYRLIPGRRELLADGKPLQVGERAFDVLLRLIEAQGAPVGKDDLLKAVWPGQSVERNALQAQISALRKAFGAERDLIRTVSGRGYQLNTQVVEQPPAVDLRADRARRAAAAGARSAERKPAGLALRSRRHRQDPPCGGSGSPAAPSARLERFASRSSRRFRTRASCLPPWPTRSGSRWPAAR